MSERTLKHRLTEALDGSMLDVHTLASRTKIPAGTIRALCGEPVSAILPERVYLRGQTLMLAKELGLDREEISALFEEAYPEKVVDTSDLDRPRFGAGTTVLAASLGTIALLAIVLAFAH